MGALDRALASIDWPLREAQRDLVAAGQSLQRTHNAAGFLLLSSGSATIRSGTESLEAPAGSFLVFPHGHCFDLRAHEDATLIYGWFLPSDPSAQTLGTFPHTLMIREFSVLEPTMVALVEGLLKGGSRASGHRRAGDMVVCGLIAATVLSSAIRLWAELGCAPDRWLHRVSDPFISRALDAMHESPGRAWSVSELAQVATMSRSSFAERFATLVGQTPASYLTDVRMESGKQVLLREHVTIADAALQLGYESEAGFRRAFQRHTGVSPAAWRTRQRAQSVPAAEALPAA